MEMISSLLWSWIGIREQLDWGDVCWYVMAMNVEEEDYPWMSTAVNLEIGFEREEITFEGKMASNGEKIE